MLRRFFVFFVLLSAVYAKTPRPLVDVPIQSPDKKNINLRQYRGHVLWLVIFSLDCDDCQRTLNVMAKLQREFGLQGLQIVAAAGDDNARFLLQPYISRYRPPFPVGYLDKNAILRIADLAPDARPFVPIIMCITRDGVVRFQFFGDNPMFKQDVEKTFRVIAENMLAPVQKPTQKVVVPSGQAH